MLVKFSVSVLNAPTSNELDMPRKVPPPIKMRAIVAMTPTVFFLTLDWMLVIGLEFQDRNNHTETIN